MTERKTKTVSYTVYEDDFTPGIEAVFNALIKNYQERHNSNDRIEATTQKLFAAIFDYGCDVLGKDETYEIHGSACKKANSKQSPSLP